MSVSNIKEGYEQGTKEQRAAGCWLLAAPHETSLTDTAEPEIQDPKRSVRWTLDASGRPNSLPTNITAAVCSNYTS